MTATELTKKQNEVLETGIGATIAVQRIDGEYTAWRVCTECDDTFYAPEEGSLWPTIGEAVENIIWQAVDEIVKGEGNWEQKTPSEKQQEREEE